MEASENFQKLMNTYSQKHGFVFIEGSTMWNSIKKHFDIYSDWFKSIMGYNFFIKNCVK